MEDNYIAQDITKDENDLLTDAFLEGKIHPEFLPMTTYDMAQMEGYGAMVVRAHGGRDENGVIQPSHGMWIKVEDFMTYLSLTNGMEMIRKNNTRFRPLENPVKLSESPKKKKKPPKSVKSSKKKIKK